jgi:hypothetical protein
MYAGCPFAYPVGKSEMPTFTSAYLATLAPPDGRRDTTVFEGTGFGVRVYKSGHRVFVMQARLRDGSARREILGPVGELSISDARNMAKERLAELAVADKPTQRSWTARKIAEALLAPRIKLDPETAPGLTHLYRHFDRNGRLLYVGITRRLQTRQSHHKAQSSWFHRLALTAIDDCATQALAEEAEAEAILREKPRYNRFVRVNNHDSEDTRSPQPTGKK